MENKLSRIKIDFIVAGFPKSGTTSLASILSKQKHVCFPKKKEPCIFNVESPNLGNLDIFFSHREPSQLLAEASQRYSNRDRYPYTAKNIYQHNPDVKLIFIARHPLLRSLSHFKMLDRDKDLPIGIDKSFDDPGVFLNAIKNSLYFYQLEPYLDYIPKSQIKILWFEHLASDLENICDELTIFLGIPIKKPSGNIHENAESIKRRSSSIYRKLNSSAMYNIIKSFIPITLRNQYRDYIKYSPRKQSRYQLSEHFIKRFYEFIWHDINLFLDVAGAPESIRRYYLQCDVLNYLDYQKKSL